MVSSIFIPILQGRNIGRDINPNQPPQSSVFNRCVRLNSIMFKSLTLWKLGRWAFNLLRSETSVDKIGPPWVKIAMDWRWGAVEGGRATILQPRPEQTLGSDGGRQLPLAVQSLRRAVSTASPWPSPKRGAPGSVMTGIPALAGHWDAGGLWASARWGGTLVWRGNPGAAGRVGPALIPARAELRSACETLWPQPRGQLSVEGKLPPAVSRRRIGAPGPQPGLCSRGPQTAGKPTCTERPGQWSQPKPVLPKGFWAQRSVVDGGCTGPKAVLVRWAPSPTRTAEHPASSQPTHGKDVIRLVLNLASLTCPVTAQWVRSCHQQFLVYSICARLSGQPLKREILIHYLLTEVEKTWC